MSNDSNKAAFVHVPLILLASSLVVSAGEMKTVDDFRDAAAKANAVLTIPDWEQTPEAVEAAMKNAIAKANAALDRDRRPRSRQGDFQEHCRRAG